MTITARKPGEVAREVEQAMRDGCHAFVLARMDRGGMLDQERLGAARYAAGLQSKVELEAEVPAAAAAVR